jgi:cytochrome c-type biogenesis protein CcmH
MIPLSNAGAAFARALGRIGQHAAGFRPACTVLVLVLVLCGAPLRPAQAGEAPEVGADPAAERHMMALASQLRCPQCQNQTLADSAAPLAVDLRQQIRELLAQGMSDAQIQDYLVARYGDFVLYRPPVKSKTLVLWFGPALALVGGMLALYLVLRRRNARLAAEEAAEEAAGAASSRDLSAAEALRAQHLLAKDAEEGSWS